MADPSHSDEIARLEADIERLSWVAEEHRLLLDATDTGFVILDEHGHVLEANREYVRLAGKERFEQIVGRSVTQWTAPYDVARNTVEVRRCLDGGEIRNLEVDYIWEDGHVVPIEVNARARRLPSGFIVLSVCRDISERRRAEEELRNSELRYRGTIDSMEELIHVVDEDLRILLINRTGRAWLVGLGIDEDIVGRSVFEVFPFLSPAVREEYRRVFHGAQTLITRERNTVGGRDVETETRKIPIVERGCVASVVTVIRDVTEHVRAEERLRQAEKMDALGQLAGGIAHDFNNQLAAIMGYAELLVRRLEDDALREYAIGIARAAERSSDLTRQLLAFARKGVASPGAVDVHSLLSEMVAMLARTIDPGISIVARLDAENAVVTGDPGQLESAFLNLALNARDAMPNGGTLLFATDVVDAIAATGGLGRRLTDGGHLRVRVSDTGVGMTQDVRRHLFEPFFTTKVPGRGTGMGLAAAYGTISSHRGSILVESEPGKGSVFTVLLPLAQASARPMAPRADGAIATGRGRILIADDEQDVLRATAASLAALGYEVTARADAREALSFYLEDPSRIDLVVLDVMMPGLSGPNALREMRRADADLPAILCSGQPLREADLVLVEEGGVAFLEKPFKLQALARCVAETLAAQRSRLAAFET